MKREDTGIFLAMMCELALTMPEICMNCSIWQRVRGRGSVGDLIIGVLPFRTDS